jgi:hypothetical protein
VKKFSFRLAALAFLRWALKTLENQGKTGIFIIKMKVSAPKNAGPFFLFIDQKRLITTGC